VILHLFASLKALQERQLQLLTCRENCFEFELTEGSTKAGTRIRVATASVEECRIWSSILKKAMVPCKLT